jgi:hypothetical protein
VLPTGVFQTSPRSRKFVTQILIFSFKQNTNEYVQLVKIIKVVSLYVLLVRVVILSAFTGNIYIILAGPSGCAV